MELWQLSTSAPRDRLSTDLGPVEASQYWAGTGRVPTLSPTVRSPAHSMTRCPSPLSESAIRVRYPSRLSESAVRVHYPSLLSESAVRDTLLVSRLTTLLVSRLTTLLVSTASLPSPL